MTETEWPDVDPDAIPGSRPRVEHKPPEPKHRPEIPWDAYPKTFRVNGQDMVLFDAPAIVRALGLTSVQTIYYWERKGWFPRTDIRAPRRSQHVFTTRHGSKANLLGRRLYPQAFVEGCIAIARELDLIDKPGQTIEGTGFSERVLDLWEETHPR